MFTLTISTTAMNFLPDGPSGAALADLLREVADHVEDVIQILPVGSGEWNTEIYNVAPGVTYTLTEA